jgi:alanine racemase
MCAVVKADGYGHGGEIAARAARAAGAEWLAVATAEEAAQLRRAGITDARILVLGPLTATELAVALAAEADLVAWSEAFVSMLPSDARVHVKLDTGMGRYGTREPVEADRIAKLAGDRLVGLMTHFATADELDDDGYFARQLDTFRAWVEPLKARAPGLIVHAANSAAALRDPASHFDLCRCGIATYGIDPFHADASAHGLRPALRMMSYVAALKTCVAGQSVGYGRRFVAPRTVQIATVPVGYADGLSRRLGKAWQASVRDTLCPIAGAVSMDTLALEVPAHASIEAGDEVMLLGGSLSAEKMAQCLDTISYEVTARIGSRVPRVIVNG